MCPQAVADNQVVQHRCGFKQVGGLERPPYPKFGHIVASHTGNICAVEQDSARCWLMYARDQVKECTFTSTVRADDGVDLIGAELHGNVVYRGEATKHLGQV